jgi:uncharacterized protein with von Willebrand factor type A (vWA) domain
MYDAKEAVLVQKTATKKEEANMMPAWAAPFFGVVALFSLSALVGVRTRRSRSTRQVQIVDPMQQMEEQMSDGGEPLLLDDDAILE